MPFSKPSKTNRVWLIAGFFMLVFIATNTVIAYNSIKTLAQTHQSIANTLHVITVIKDLYAQLVSAESSQRGYIITSDKQYLEPYVKSTGELGSILNSLDQLTTEIPEQKNNFRELSELAKKKISNMRLGLTLKESKRDAELQELFYSDRGHDLMASIIVQIKHMEEIEYNLLDARSVAAKKGRASAFRTLLFSNSFGLILILIIYLSVNKHIRQRLLYSELIHKANEELEQKVKVRTESLEHYSEELQRSNRELQNFAFVASHDLQEPLRKIRAFGARLNTTCADQLDDRGKDYINRMFAASERMSALIDDLLTFSRVFTQQNPFEKIDLSDLLNVVLDDISMAIDDSEADIKVAALPVVECDASQMRRLFQNLITNAIKFRKPNSQPSVQIECDTFIEDDEEWCRITIIDDGIGFEQQFAEKIFTLFQRLHARDEYSGTGLGLAICRRIVERHGGVIKAFGELGKGSRFVIELPLTQSNRPIQDFLPEEANP